MKSRLLRFREWFVAQTVTVEDGAAMALVRIFVGVSNTLGMALSFTTGHQVSQPPLLGSQWKCGAPSFVAFTM
jgi:hypothetical protein